MKKSTTRKGKHEDAIREALDDFWAKNCYPPTLRDLMRICNVPSTSIVTYTLKKLERRGHIYLCQSHPVPKWVIDAISLAA